MIDWGDDEPVANQILDKGCVDLIHSIVARWKHNYGEHPRSNCGLITQVWTDKKIRVVRDGYQRNRGSPLQPLERRIIHVFCSCSSCIGLNGIPELHHHFSDICRICSKILRSAGINQMKGFNSNTIRTCWFRKERYFMITRYQYQPCSWTY